MALLKSDDCDEWEQVMKSYDACIAQVASEKKKFGHRLPELDAWRREELPVALKSSGGMMSQEELLKLVDWKLLRGKMRPIRRFIVALPDAQVRKVTKEALGGIVVGKVSEEEVDGAMDTLLELKGVGPATASALLAAAHPSIPFMADEALSAIGPREYTKKAFLGLLKATRAKSAVLGDSFPASRIVDALWAHDVSKRVVGLKRSHGGSAGGGGKRVKGEE